MASAVEHVHHRYGKRIGAGAADVAVERHAELVGCGARRGERNGKDGVGSEFSLVRRPVQFDHLAVQTDLIEAVISDQGVCDLPVHVRDGVQNALAAVSSLVSVPKLDRFMNAGGRAGRYECGTLSACFRSDHAGDRGVAAGIQNFSCTYRFDS